MVNRKIFCKSGPRLKWLLKWYMSVCMYIVGSDFPRCDFISRPHAVSVSRSRRRILRVSADQCFPVVDRSASVCIAMLFVSRLLPANFRLFCWPSTKKVGVDRRCHWQLRLRLSRDKSIFCCRFHNFWGPTATFFAIIGQYCSFLVPCKHCLNCRLALWPKWSAWLF